jgi:hypothetical protein
MLVIAGATVVIALVAAIFARLIMTLFAPILIV